MEPVGMTARELDLLLRALGSFSRQLDMLPHFLRVADPEEVDALARRLGIPDVSAH